MMRHLLRPALRLVWRLPALRSLFLTVTYGSVLTLCLWMSYQLRFDFNVPPLADMHLLSIGAVTVGIQLLGLLCFHQFDGLLTYFSNWMPTVTAPMLSRCISASGGTLKSKRSW